MKELNSVEIIAVSGAGKIQDHLSSFFGSKFGSCFDKVPPASGLGYSKEEVVSFGSDFGKRIGGIIESHLQSVNDFISSWKK